MNFTAPRYTLLFLNSEIYVVHVINCEWSRSVNFLLCLFCIRYKLCFSNNWYQSGLHFRICITCFVSSGIRDSNFMMLKDSTINFLHGCWNYSFIKTDIDVIILFKFDIKNVKLNFKAMASMEFSFDLKLNLLCSYDDSLFMKNRWKLLGENSEKFNFSSFDWSRIPFDWSNSNRESFESTREFVMNLLKFRLIENSFRSIEFAFSIDRIGIENRSSHLECLLKFSSWFRSIERCIRSIESWEFWIFIKCFPI